MSSLPTSALELESALYIGIILSAILYGIYLVVTGLSFTFLFKNVNSTRSQKFFYVVLTFVLFNLNTLAFVASPLLGQNMWIVHRDDPGGPSGYYDSTAPDWYQEMGELAQTMANLFADVLLIYRCYIIFGSRLWIVVFPCLCSVAFFATGLYSDAAARFSPAQTTYSVASLILTTVLNVIVTVMICARLILMHFKMRKTVTSTASTTYVGVAAILIESAVPMTALGVLLSILQATNVLWLEIVTSIWIMTVAISPQLIILRVAMGRAWAADTASRLTNMNTAGTGMVFAARDRHVHHQEDTKTGDIESVFECAVPSNIQISVSLASFRD